MEDMRGPSRGRRCVGPPTSATAHTYSPRSNRPEHAASCTATEPPYRGDGLGRPRPTAESPHRTSASPTLAAGSSGLFGGPALPHRRTRIARRRRVGLGLAVDRFGLLEQHLAADAARCRGLPPRLDRQRPPPPEAACNPSRSRATTHPQAECRQVGTGPAEAQPPEPKATGSNPVGRANLSGLFLREKGLFPWVFVHAGRR